MKKLAARHANWMMAFWMSLLMSGIMSGAITLITAGLVAGGWTQWARAFLLSWPIAFAAAYLTLPLIRRLVFSLVHTHD